MKKFIVTQQTNLKDFTDATYPQGSFVLPILLRAKDVKVNGVKVGANCALNVGDEVCYYTTKKQEEKPSHVTLYEDENVLIVGKFSGVSTEALTCELQEKTDARAAHRLDRNTSGVMVFAKNDEAERSLHVAFQNGDMQKTYLCLCVDHFKKMHDYCTAYLVKDEKASLVKIYDAPTAGGVKIITEYTVLKRMGDHALVEIKLHTGKTHQIRAHMAHLGCPVLGDEKYGNEVLNKKYNVKRQCLVAKTLCFGAEGVLSYLKGKSFTVEFFPELPTQKS